LSKYFKSSNSGLPLIILEAGVNHDGNLDKAKLLIDLASQSGADYIKFQTYSAEKLAAKTSPSYWNLEEESTRYQIELFKKYDGFSLEDYNSLIAACDIRGIRFLTTCFDVDWLNLLADSLPFFKIASADITNFALVSAIAHKQKPILMSTGAASFDEISAALDLIRSITDVDVCLMHCVLNYPTEFENANLGRITELKDRFPDVLIGYSDHTRPDYSHKAISIAVSLGAQIIEKHFTYDKNQVGNDHYHSFDLADVEVLYKNLKTQVAMCKFDEDSFLETQSDARKFARRGLYAARNIARNSIISIDDVIPLRPTLGEDGHLGSEIYLVIGKRCKAEILEGEPLFKSNLE
jgi:N-acetylneuraminate synthase